MVHNSPLQDFHNFFVLLSRPNSAIKIISLEIKRTQKVRFLYGLFHIVICTIFYLRYNCSVIEILHGLIWASLRVVSTIIN